MKKRVWVVRVAIDEYDKGLAATPFLECLRYAGLVVLHNERIFDVLPPGKVHDTKQWADQNAERMSSFGYNAVAAPYWGDPERVTP